MSDHPYASIKGSKIFRKGFLDFPEREIGEIRDDAESSIKYFESKYDIFKQKVDDLESKIAESENKGSFLMKLIHLKESIPSYDGLGDFEELYNRLIAQENYLQELITQNRVKNYEIKKALLEELEVLKDHYNLNEAAERIQEIKSHWIKTGAVLEEHQSEFESLFNEYLEDFNKRMATFFEDRRKMTEEITSEYKTILTKAQEIKKQGDVKKGTEKLKLLQKEWKELGRIPAEEYNKLKTEFQQINDELFGKLKEIKREEGHNRLEKIRKLREEKELILDELISELEKENINLLKVKENYLSRWNDAGNIFHKEIHRLNEKFRTEILKINELKFLENLSRKKAKGFDQLTITEKNKIKSKIIRDLINRDERELQQYKKNMEIFSLSTGKIDKMVNNKIQAKETSLGIKKEIERKLKSTKSH